MENEKKHVNLDSAAIIIICAIELVLAICNLIRQVSYDQLRDYSFSSIIFYYIIPIIAKICYILAFSSEKMKRYAGIPFVYNLIHWGYYSYSWIRFLSYSSAPTSVHYVYLVEDLLLTAAWALMIALTVICFSKRKEMTLKIQAKKLWLIPCCLAGLYVLLYAISFFVLDRYASWSNLLSVAELIIYPLCLFYFSAHNIAFTEAPLSFNEEKNEQNAYTENADNSPSANKSTNNQYGYCSLGKHVALLLLTFRIWLLIWIYHITDVTNIPDREKRNPTNKLLLCMFVPFYQIYWIYETSKRVEMMAKEKNLECNISTICLICEFLLPIVPPILIQDKLNAVISASPAKQPPEYQTEVHYTKSENVTNISDELTAYKEMLDIGLISPEDYEKKKNQLLGLD